jgi:hypothetical protein
LTRHSLISGSLPKIWVRKKEKKHILVLPSIEGLRSNKQNDVVCRDPKKDLVASVVEWLIFVLIDLFSGRSVSYSIEKVVKREALLKKGKHTCVEMILLAWTAILYKLDPTVLVLTVPAFRLVIATGITKSAPIYLIRKPCPSFSLNSPRIAWT